jgi:hypothetical protein
MAERELGVETQFLEILFGSGCGTPCLILLLRKHRRDRNQSINCVGDGTQKACVPHWLRRTQHNASLWYGVTQRVHNNCYFIHGQPGAPRHYRRRRRPTRLVCMRCTQTRAFCWCVYFAPARARFCAAPKWAIPTQHAAQFKRGPWKKFQSQTCQRFSPFMINTHRGPHQTTPMMWFFCISKSSTCRF